MLFSRTFCQYLQLFKRITEFLDIIWTGIWVNIIWQPICNDTVTNKLPRLWGQWKEIFESGRKDSKLLFYLVYTEILGIVCIYIIRYAEMVCNSFLNFAGITDTFLVTIQNWTNQRRYGKILEQEQYPEMLNRWIVQRLIAKLPLGMV